MDLREAVTLFESKVFAVALEDEKFCRDDMSPLMQKAYTQMMLFIDTGDKYVFSEDVVKYLDSPVVDGLISDSDFHSLFMFGGKELIQLVCCDHVHNHVEYHKIIRHSKLEVLQWFHSVQPKDSKGVQFTHLFIEASERKDGLEICKWLDTIDRKNMRYIKEVLVRRNEPLALWMIAKFTPEEWNTKIEEEGKSMNESRLFKMACSKGMFEVAKLLRSIKHPSSSDDKIIAMMSGDISKRNISGYPDIYKWLYSIVQFEIDIENLLSLECVELLEWVHFELGIDIVPTFSDGERYVPPKVYKWLLTKNLTTAVMSRFMFVYECSLGHLDAVVTLFKSDYKICVDIGFEHACEHNRIVVAEYLYNIGVKQETIDDVIKNVAVKTGSKSQRMLRYLQTLKK